MSMSRKMRRRGHRAGRDAGRLRLDLRTRLGLLLLAVGGGAALGLGVYAGYGPGSHPDPRPDITAADVLPSDRFADEYIGGVYGLAAEIPQVLDALFCYCRCHRHSGHRSLLTCFESTHGAQCPACLRSAVVAYRLHGEESDIATIRRTIDEIFRP